MAYICLLDLLSCTTVKTAAAAELGEHQCWVVLRYTLLPWCSSTSRRLIASRCLGTCCSSFCLLYFHACLAALSPIALMKLSRRWSLHVVSCRCHLPLRSLSTSSSPLRTAAAADDTLPQFILNWRCAKRLVSFRKSFTDWASEHRW